METLGPETLAWIAGILIVAGMAKGLTGIGLPVVGAPLLALILDVQTTVVLLAMSLVITNFWQAFSTDNWIPALRRMWPVFLPMPFAAFFGVKVLSSADPTLLLGVLGTAVLIFSVIMQMQPNWRLPYGFERPLAPLVGIASGTLGGMSSMFAPPVVMFYASLRIDREVLIAAFGVTYLCGVIPMVVSLGWFGLMGLEELGASTLAAVPGFIGLLLGQVLRKIAPERIFRKIMLGVMTLSGLVMLQKAVFAVTAAPSVTVPIPGLNG